MKLTINGEPRDLDASDVVALVEGLGLPAAATLVEHNGVALRRDEWSGCAVRDGDRFELIRIVAGG